VSVALPYYREKLDARYLHSNYQTPFDFTDVSEIISRNGSGTKRAGWKKYSQPNRSAPTGYSMRWDEYRKVRVILNHTETGPNGLGGTQFNYSYQQYWSTGDPYTIRDQSVLSDTGYKAKARLFDKLKGEGTNVANMLGERKQIVKSVESLLNTIVYTVRDLRRGNVTSAIRRMGGDPLTARALRKKDIANQWLSLQYGWKPLLSDVYGLVQGLHKRVQTNPWTVMKVSAKARSTKASPELGGGIAGNKSRGTLVTDALTGYMIRVKPDERIAELAALGVTNPAVVAWEITPWSFVVDWFIPIGTYLEQFTAADGWVFLDGCVSTLVRVRESVEGNWQNNYTTAGWNYTDMRNISGDFRTAVFTRSVLSSIPIPELPRFKNPISVGHIENSIALLSQLFGRK
jgi:hypothetical protein